MGPIELAILRAAEEEQDVVLEEYRRAWDYYEGNTPDTLATSTEGADGRIINLPDDNVRLPVVQIVVDTATDFLFGDDLVIGLEEGNDDAQEYIARAWDASGRMETLQDLRTNGATTGQAWLKLKLPDGGSTVNLRNEPPQVVTLDPASVSVLLHPDDHRKVLVYRVTWDTRDKNGKLLTKRDQWTLQENGMWLYELRHSREGNDWFTVDSRPWPFTWAPLFHAKNLPAPNQYHGTPDVSKILMDLQDAINGVASDSRRVSRLLGHPQLWFAGVNENSIDVDPGKALILPENGRAGVLGPQASPDGYLKLIDKYRDIFHEAARVPRVAAGQLEGIGNLSGLAMQILYGPLSRRAQTQRRFYGGLIGRVNDALLSIARYDPAKTVIPWPHGIPSDPAEAAETASKKQAAGVSIATTLEEMGYDSDDEEERRSEESPPGTPNLADALADFDRT